MYRLFYISNVSPFFNPDSLVDLCAHSAANSRELGIGGALVFNGTNFGQVLEGEKDKVLQLSERIQMDVRHTGYHVISSREVSERFFEDWGMNLIQGFDFSDLEEAMRA